MCQLLHVNTSLFVGHKSYSFTSQSFPWCGGAKDIELSLTIYNAWTGNTYKSTNRAKLIDFSELNTTTPKT